MYEYMKALYLRFFREPDCAELRQEIREARQELRARLGREDRKILLRLTDGLPLLREDREKAWWLGYLLAEQVLGEVSVIGHINDLDLVERPKEGDSFPLSDLPQALRDMGCRLWDDAGDYLENSDISYELEPVEDPEADWRLDICAGSARLPVLINEYLSAESDAMDEYHKDGITAGFLCYSLEGFQGEDRAEQILRSRDELWEAIREHAGAGAAALLGGATGLYYGYLDFIAWDLPAVLEAAKAFFAAADPAWGGFHVFRRGVGAVRLWEREKEPEVDPETGSLLSAEDIQTLESFDDGVSGYFGKMLQWLEDFIERGVGEGRFTQR